jgi:hypothetical protein
VGGDLSRWLARLANPQASHHGGPASGIRVADNHRHWFDGKMLCAQSRVRWPRA